MDLKVFIGVSVDLTLFGGRDPSSEALDALLDEASQQLATHLWPTVVSQKAALRQLHATCGLYDQTDTTAARARLRRQGEQLELELSVDWRPWFERSATDQAAFVLEHVRDAIATALDAKQQRTLAEACRAFRPVFDLEAALAKRRAWVADWETQAPVTTVVLTRDGDGHVRQLQPLTRRRGTLWLMLRQHAGMDDAAANALLDRIEAFATERDLGRPDGRSMGSGAMDISFKVRNLQAAGAALDEFLRDAFPSVDYLISDDFEVAFPAPA